MNKDELLEQMAQYLEDDAPHLWREQNLGEQELKQLAAKYASRHYGGQWTEQEQEVIDSISSEYQHLFIVCARGYSPEALSELD